MSKGLAVRKAELTCTIEQSSDTRTQHTGKLGQEAKLYMLPGLLSVDTVLMAVGSQGRAAAKWWSVRPVI